MNVKKGIVWDVIGMSEDLASGYEKRGSPLSGVDRAKFEKVFRGISSRLALKKRIKVVDAVGFCDALRKVIVLE